MVGGWGHDDRSEKLKELLHRAECAQALLSGDSYSSLLPIWSQRQRLLLKTNTLPMGEVHEKACRGNHLV